MTSEVRSIVVGMGGVSWSMLDILQDRPWHEVVGVVDIHEEALRTAQAKLNLDDSALFQDLDSALENTDANTVLINTPSELHYAQTRAVLDAGLTPLVAKPFTNNYEQAVELVRLAADRQIKLCVAQQMRFHRHYLALKRFVESGQLGQIEHMFFLNAKPRHAVLNLRGMAQPVLYEMSCHHFDCMLSFLPEAVPLSIICDGHRPSWSVYDGPCMINALIRFDHGLHVLYHAGYSSQSDCYEVRLEGTEGVLRCRGLHMSRPEMTYEFAPRGGQFAVLNIDQDIPVTQPWSIMLDQWYSYLRGGPEPAFSGRNNLRVFALLSAAIDSVDTDQYVAVATNPRYQNAFEERS